MGHGVLREIVMMRELVCTCLLCTQGCAWMVDALILFFCLVRQT